jgi:hypothetical protein
MGNSAGAKPLRVDELERAKALSALGHSYRAIGMELGRSDKTIKKALTRSPEVIQDVKDIKVRLADSFEGLAGRMVTSITDHDILKLDAYRRTLSAAVATDKMLLSRGEATSIDVHVLLDAVQAVREMRRSGPVGTAVAVVEGQ